jgi:hypothetical protein
MRPSRQVIHPCGRFEACPDWGGRGVDSCGVQQRGPSADRVDAPAPDREAGLQLPPDEDLRAGLRELAYLEQSIGRTGMLALKGLHVAWGRDKWHRWLLKQSR